MAAGFAEELVDKVADVFVKLYEVYTGEDATLVEVNPLVLTEEGEIIALDGKVSIDENAAFRHPDHEALEDKAAADPLEAKAKEHDLNYVKLDGQVGIIGNGAGLVMSTLDVVAYAGEAHGGVKPANFLDIGGGASAAVMAAGLDVILGDPQVKSVFVNVFGGITACDAVANGIVGALDTLGDTATKPLVVRLDGNKVEEGRAILRDYATTRSSPSPRPWTRAPTRPPSSPTPDPRHPEKERREMSIFLNKDSKVIVQGITGGEGTKHTALMLKAGTQVVGGVNARKAGTTVRTREPTATPSSCPSSPRSPRPSRRPAPTSRSRSSPPPSPRTP